MSSAISRTTIESRICEFRGSRVMLDRDLAELYGVPTKVLNQAVMRNQERFPADFMFRLEKAELDDLRSQSVTSSWGGVRYPPRAFTEYGILMLSNVLRSDRAIKVSIQIVRVFGAMKHMLHEYKDLLDRVQRFGSVTLSGPERNP